MESTRANEAKTNPSRLLDREALGGEIQITRNGRPVARLVPDVSPPPGDMRALIAEIEEFRRGRTLGDGVTIRDLIEEGRRC